jgi:hemerythrin-like domain-containing protein
MSRAGAPTTDGIAELRADHRSIASVQTALASTGPKDSRARKKLVKQLTTELATHLDLEEQVIFPLAQDEAGTKAPVLKAHEQHQLLKNLLEGIRSTEPQEEVFMPKVEVLADLLHAHVGEEQRAIFAPLRAALTRGQLRELGERLRQGREALANPKDYLRSP